MGILSQGSPQEQQPQQSKPQGGSSSQELFDKFVVNGMKIIHTPEVTDGIIQRVQSNQDRVDAIGEASLDVIQRLEQSAGQNGIQTTANTIINGMNVVVGEVVNIAEASGINPLSDEEKYQAFSWAFSNYISSAVQSGKISKEDLIQLGDKMSQEKASKGGK